MPETKVVPTSDKLSVPSVSPARAKEAITTMSPTKKWNTKNLGLRLGADLTAGASAAGLVAPIIMIIDKAIMQNASGQNTLGASLKESLKTLVTKPHRIYFSKPFALIWMLYGGTFLTANVLDTATSTIENKPATLVTAGTLKFAASSTANIGLCLIKDASFAKLFGASGPPRAVPLPSFALFAFRDCLTIFASFNVPPLLGPVLTTHMSDKVKKYVTGATAAQFLAPAGIQLISTPMHLLGLDLYNRPRAAWKERWAIVRKNWSISALARMGRIVPAFGIGGTVNKKVRKGLLEKLE